MELKNLPVVDWDQGLKLAGHNKELASDMLSMLAKCLPDELNTINHFHHAHNANELLKSVHKLHGAIAYCGLPRLKAILHYLESNLKSKRMDEIPELVEQLNKEVTLALEQVSKKN